MISAQTIAETLNGRHSGKGFIACCPAHDDKHPSLSISESDSGKVLVKCFAGCSQEAVISALRDRGIWPQPNKPLTHAKAYQRKISRDEIEAALGHELNVLIQFVCLRVADREAAQSRKFRDMRPEWRPLPDEPWDREIFAVKRIQKALEALYG